MINANGGYDYGRLYELLSSYSSAYQKYVRRKINAHKISNEELERFETYLETANPLPFDDPDKVKQSAHEMAMCAAMNEPCPTYIDPCSLYPVTLMAERREE